MITVKEADLEALRQEIARLQGLGADPASNLVKVGLVNLQSTVPGDHVSMSDVLGFLEEVRVAVFRSSKALVRSYIKSMYPIGSTFRVQVLRPFGLSDPSGECTVLGLGIYTVNVVDHPRDSARYIRWGVPGGMNQGTGMDNWLRYLGLIPEDWGRRPDVRAKLLED
jgi:hypothetical protein